MPQKPTPPKLDGVPLFRARMKREGREGSFDELIATHREAGKSERLATYAAMADMGYKSPKAEELARSIAACRAKVDLRRQKQRAEQRKYRERKREKLRAEKQQGAG